MGSGLEDALASYVLGEKKATEVAHKYVISFSCYLCALIASRFESFCTRKGLCYGYLWPQED